VSIDWPAELYLIRHGESAGNVARDRAMAAGAGVINIDMRDCDVPLSELGERQSTALGRWCARNVGGFDSVISSPYVRAQQTAAFALRSAGWGDVPTRTDERLREREFGILDRLTRTGIEERYPEQAEMRAVLGKFYYRPPGGESWTDVILRLRSIVATLSQEYAGQRVAIVSHQVVVLCFRYLLERLGEADILAIDREGDVANCSLTTYRFDSSQRAYALQAYNVVAPLEEAGEAVTRESDVPVAPR